MTENIEKRVPKGDIKFSITLSDEQKQAKQNILQHPFNFVMGKAGSGKTLLACQIALDSFFKRDYNKIVVTRPTVSNEDNGFLPGTLEEKLEPWLVPIRSNMRKVYDKSSVLDKLEQDEKVELVSLTHFRGRTFDDCVCIVDEFQNLTKSQLAMVLGRLGKNSKMVICGDLAQIDLKVKKETGFSFLTRIEEQVKGFKVFALLANHRHEIVSPILKVYQDFRD